MPVPSLSHHDIQVVTPESAREEHSLTLRTTGLFSSDIANHLPKTQTPHNALVSICSILSAELSVVSLAWHKRHFTT